MYPKTSVLKFAYQPSAILEGINTVRDGAWWEDGRSLELVLAGDFGTLAPSFLWASHGHEARSFALHTLPAVMSCFTIGPKATEPADHRGN